MVQVIPNQTLRWAGIWNVTQRYVYADVVIDDLDEKCYVNISDIPTIGGSPPSDNVENWLVLSSGSGGAVTSVVSGVGSGIQVVPTSGDVVVTTTLLAGSGITLEPSLSTTDITIIANAPVFPITSVDSDLGSGIVVNPTSGDVILSSGLVAGEGITLTPDVDTKNLTISATTLPPVNLCGIFTQANTPSTMVQLTIPGLTVDSIVLLTYIHPGTLGGPQYFVSSVPTTDTLTITCNTTVDTDDQIIWFVAKLS